MARTKPDARDPWPAGRPGKTCRNHQLRTGEGIEAICRYVEKTESDQAVSISASASRPRSLIEISRISIFLIFPATVIGKESTNL